MKTHTYPNPWDLRYFQEVAATENLSRAAERLGVGQPALSLSLKRLEEQLRVTLFLRRNKGLVLTAAGKRLLRECNRLLAAWDSVVSETRNSETALSGSYRLGCHPSVALFSVDPLLKEIYERYPKLEIQLVHGLSRVICEKIISGDVDFGIVVNPVRHPDLVLHRLATDEVGFWKSARASNGVLLYNPGLQQSQALLKKIGNKTFARTLTSDSLEVLAFLARSGLGTAILPSRVAKAVAPELRRAPGYPTYSDEIVVAYRSDFRKTASAQAIIGLLKKLSI